MEKEDVYYSILPTTTQYARNALFAGLLPTEIEKKYPKYWVNEDEEGTKNNYEAELLGELLKRYGRDIRYSYYKVLNQTYGKKLVELMPNLMVNKLNFIVYNFVDMLSHARTEMEIIRELADDEKAYRSLTVAGSSIHRFRYPRYPGRKGCERGDHHRPRFHPRGQPGEGAGRPEHQYQSAL